MSVLFNYLLSSLWTYSDEEKTPSVIPQPPPLPSTISLKTPTKTQKMLISKEDLKKVKLKSVSNIIPGPARNMPLMDKFHLGMLNKAQLKEILNVKLRHVEQEEKQHIVYPPKHPVLRELLNKIPKY